MTDIAFGAPGIQPTFAAGDKDLVSTSLGSSRVWLTVGVLFTSRSWIRRIPP